MTPSKHPSEIGSSTRVLRTIRHSTLVPSLLLTLNDIIVIRDSSVNATTVVLLCFALKLSTFRFLLFFFYFFFPSPYHRYCSLFYFLDGAFLRTF